MSQHLDSPPGAMSIHSTSMDRLPVELWSEIVILACADGGRTARSLSLVCRFFQEVVQPIRFTSVIIVSDFQLHSLARALAGSEATTAPVYHLLFSVHCIAKGLFGYNPDVDARWQAIESSWRTVITHAAPTLRSLTVHEPPLFDPYDRRLNLSFPMLEDLSIPWLNPNGDATRHARTPRLRRLHLSQTLQCAHNIWVEIASAAPALTHVRFSGVGLSVGIGSRSAFAPYLRALFGVPVREPLRPPRLPDEVLQLLPESDGARDAEVTAKSLPFLREVCVQPQGRGNLRGSVDFQKEEREKVKMGVGRVMLDCEAGGRGKVYLLPECKMRYELSEAREEFLDLVTGGDGPWKPEKALTEDML